MTRKQFDRREILGRLQAIESGGTTKYERELERRAEQAEAERDEAEQRLQELERLLRESKRYIPFMAGGVRGDKAMKFLDEVNDALSTPEAEEPDHFEGNIGANIAGGGFASPGKKQPPGPATSTYDQVRTPEFPPEEKQP